jgi:hypothetical protein
MIRFGSVALRRNVSRRIVNHQHLLAYPHGHTFRPAARDISQREGVDELAVYLPAATLFDHVDLREARRCITPVGEGMHRNATPDCRANPRVPLKLPINVRTRIGQHAFVDRRANLKQLGVNDRIHVKVVVPLYGINQLRNQRLQALAANPAGCFRKPRSARCTASSYSGCARPFAASALPVAAKWQAFGDTRSAP